MSDDFYDWRPLIDALDSGTLDPNKRKQEATTREPGELVLPREAYIFTDRYGGNYPDPETMCPGYCEGLGVYPHNVFQEQTDAEWLTVVELLKREGVSGDGYYFIKCPDCGGTGERPAPRAEA